MDSTRRTFLGTAVGALTMALAGCSGGSGTDGGGGATTTRETTTQMTQTTQTTQTTRTTTDAPATVRVRSHADLGSVLVGAEGLSLYMFDKDTKGEKQSACYDGCASAWPPLTVDGEPSAGSGVSATLTTFERETGETQVAAGGWPLYYFASDEQPGDAKGQGANDVWWVLRPDGTPVRPDSTGGGY